MTSFHGATPSGGASIASNDSDEEEGLEHEVPENTVDTDPSDKSLIIPITSTQGRRGQDPDLFIEIFPEELPQIPTSTILTVLKDECASMTVWADAALGYVRGKKLREGAEILGAACGSEHDSVHPGDRAERVRLLAASGIANLMQASNNSTGGGSSAGSAAGGAARKGSEGTTGSAGDKDDLRAMAEDRFTQATRIDQFFPMTWIGKGMLNLSKQKYDQARFFFDTTLKHAGPVLPALLGMAAVKYSEGEYEQAMNFYGQAIRLYPGLSGAGVRVGFGMCCYRLGQVDRAKAAFRRAYEIDPENVEAMAGISVLDLSTLDSTAKDYLTKQENAIKLLSVANLIDRSNAMVANHLADHYFWKWSQVPGTVTVENGSARVKGSQVMNLDPGERIRIGMTFETHVADEQPDELMGGTEFVVRDAWHVPSADGLKLWRKDFDRVVDMAKGALTSTDVSEIKAESLYILARVFHVRGDFDEAAKYYNKACKLDKNLTPARFGFAQTLIYDESFDEAAIQLKLVLANSTMATDAHAALGLLEAKAGNDRKEAHSHLKKASELNPVDPNMVLIQALALQQHESDYNQALEKYRKAIEMLENQGRPVSPEAITNMGVIYQEMKKYDDALSMYGKALNSLPTVNPHDYVHATSDDCVIREKANDLFLSYMFTGFKAVEPVVDGSNSLVLLDNAAADGVAKRDIGDVLKVGDHVRIGNSFTSQVLNIVVNEEKIIMHIKDHFSPSVPSSTGEDETTNDSNGTNISDLSIYVKRANSHRLSDPLAVSIAFNIARLHEDAGRTVAAIELHKAILKKHPSYVNSYLRLACIARDCGFLNDCSEWLKGAVKVAPGNPEVLTLVGNLHLSLADWAPAQALFDGLMQSKNPGVEAYSQLSLGNIYFSNLNAPSKYAKHLLHAGDFYRRILGKDKSNFYAANGLGTILSEKGDLFKAKEAFSRVREVSGDSIPDALLNLGHIYLAQKKHPQALQMYQSYLTRTNKFGARSIGKSKEDAEVLLYIAFAYFDWARQAELFNNSKAAPADERYRKCIEYIELAMSSNRENLVLKYNWCMVKLQAANCVLQKLTRNIPRSAQEVQDALTGLEESLPIVQQLLKWRQEGKKINISSQMLTGFINQCQGNIESAKSHLNEELKKEAEMRELRELQRIEAETQQKEKEMELAMKREREARELEARENKAKTKMMKVNSLVAGWEQESQARAAADAKKKKSTKGDGPPVALDEDGAAVVKDKVKAPNLNALFDSDEEESEEEDGSADESRKEENGTQDEFDSEAEPPESEGPKKTETDLFGDSSDEESSDELVPKKRENNGDDSDSPTSKKRRVVADD